MLGLKIWQRIRAYADAKARDAYMAENGSDTACPCCKRWGYQGGRIWKRVDENTNKMTCLECGAEAFFNFAVAPVAILTGWRPPATESKVEDRGEIDSDDGFFVVWNPDCSRSPTVRHARENSASKHAYEMARITHKGEVFYVLEAIRAYQSQGEVQKFELAICPKRRWAKRQLGRHASALDKASAVNS